MSLRERFLRGFDRLTSAGWLAGLSRVDRLLLLAGAFAAMAGFGLLALQSVLPGRGEWLLGTEARPVLAAVGIFATVEALAAALSSRRAGEAPAELPDPAATDWAAPPPGDATDGDGARATLRELAVDVVARREGVGREAARRRVEAGDWTDDRTAAAFLGDEDALVPLRTRLADWVAEEPAEQRRARRTIAELHRQAGGEWPAPARPGGMEGGPSTVPGVADGDNPDQATAGEGSP